MLILCLGYASQAIIATKASDFDAISKDPNAQIVMAEDIELGKEFKEFFGILDGHGHTLTATNTVFESMKGAYVRNLTIVAKQEQPFAREAEACKFVSVRFIGATFGQIHQTNIQQSYIEGAGVFCPTVDALELRGSALRVTGSPAFGTVSNSIFSNALVEVHESSSVAFNFIATDLKMMRFVLQAHDAADVTMFSTALIQVSMSDVDFSFDLYNSIGTLTGVSPQFNENNIFNVSVGINATGSNAEFYGIAPRAVSNTISQFMVYWFLDQKGPVSTFAGAFGILDSANKISLLNVFIRGKITIEMQSELDNPVVSGIFMHLPANDATSEQEIQQIAVTYDFTLETQSGVTVAAVGSRLDNVLKAALVFGTINYNVIEDGVERVLFFSKMVNESHGGVIRDSYNQIYLNAAASKAVSSVVMSGFANLCDGCTIEHSGSYSDPEQFSYTMSGAYLYRLAGAVAYFAGESLIDDVYAAMALDIFAVEMGSVSGFIGCDFSGKIHDVQIQYNLSVYSCDNVSFVMAFWQFDADKTEIDGLTALCLQCGHFTDVGLAIVGTVDGNNIFVDCGLLGVNPTIPQCKTSDEMKSDELVESLGATWAKHDELNMGYPYSMDTFVATQSTGAITIDTNTTYFDITVWGEDSFSHRVFPSARCSYCRGSCDGFGFSPLAFDCNNENELCFVADPTEVYYSQVCYSFNLGTSCDKGQTTCEPSSYVYQGLSCKPVCADCGNGYCKEETEGATCMCDLYYSGEKCAVFDCNSHSTACYGLGACVSVDDAKVCQCEDATSVYNNGQCLEDACPGLKQKQGVCLEDGPHCFERYELTGTTCDKCASGYTMSGDKCSDMTGWIIFGSIAGALVVLAAIAFACWYFLKHKKQPADEKQKLLENDK